MLLALPLLDATIPITILGTTAAGATVTVLALSAAEVTGLLAIKGLAVANGRIDKKVF